MSGTPLERQNPSKNPPKLLRNPFRGFCVQGSLKRSPKLGTHPNRMAPNDWIGSPLALETFLHLHAWHAKCPKDSGHKYCLELNTHSAGIYGIAFELNTVLHHQWRYDTNWVKKLQDFDLLSFYNKHKLCESALQSLGYDPKRLPRTADPGYGHSQLDSSGDADAEAYDAQINALMDGTLPPSLGAPRL